MMPIWGVVALIGLGLLGCWFDVSSRRLPNWLSAIVLLAGLGVAFASGGLPAMPTHLFHCIIALAAGIGLYAVSVIGAGDAKFYSAIAAWFPLADGLRLLVSVAMTGALVLLVWALIRRLRGQKVFTLNGQPTDGVPYGVAIVGGAMLVLISSRALLA